MLNPYKPSPLVLEHSNSADPYQIAHTIASDQGIHCLHTE